MKLLKSYNFWVRLVAVLVLLVRVIGTEFGFSIDSGLIMDIATLVASILVIIGVIQVPNQGENSNLGSDIMGTIEQVKKDIITAKEKLSEMFGDSKEKIEEVFVGLGLVDKEETAEETVETIEIDQDEIQETSIVEGETVTQETVPNIEESSEETINIEETQTSREADELRTELKTKLKEYIIANSDQILDEIVGQMV